MELLLVAVIFWILPIFVGHAIGKAKNRHGGWWGFFLGWLGVIIVAILPAKAPMTLGDLEKKKGTLDSKYYEKKRAELLATKTHRECPHCKEQMRRDASVCPHCQRDSDAWTLNEGFWWLKDGDGNWLYLDELSGEWRRPVSQAEAANPAASV